MLYLLGTKGGIMRDLIWDIAKSGEEDLSNTELQSIEEPNE